MDQKGYKINQKGLKYMKKGFLDQKYLFFAQFFLAEFWVLPPPVTKIGLPNKISGIGGYHLHLEKFEHF